MASGHGSMKSHVNSQKSYQHDGWDSMNVCSAPGNAKEFLGRRKARKDESLTGTLRSWIVQHQIGISINLLLLLALAHICFPRARRRTRKFFELSYFDPVAGVYTQGPDDLLFVAYCIVVFTGLRAAVMTYALLPFARWMGLTKTKSKVRFAEQAWLFIYYAVFWSLGLYIMYTSKYMFDPREMWTDFPTRSMSFVLKWYYLVQFAFWLQQIVVVNIEERRKDHWQMFTHHIVTCLLIFMSYGYYQTKIGNAILVVMDVVDLVLPAAKMLKYCGFQTACDVAFGIFIVTWFVARHVLYLKICWSAYYDLPDTMQFGCYSSVTGAKTSTDGGQEIFSSIMQPFVNPNGPVCFNSNIHHAFLSLLLFLQGITLMWFGMILRVAWRVLQGNPADDSRSDDEGDEEEEEDEGEDDDEEDVPQDVDDLAPPAPPVEEYVGVEQLNLKRHASPVKRYRKSGAHSSGISIPGHSEPKELLGRIGCDKPS